MNLKVSEYQELANRIKSTNSRVFVYGAGMIGQIVVPYMIDKYGLYDYVECYVDADKRKSGKIVKIGRFEYEIHTPNIFDGITGNVVILLTNSKFYSVIESLNRIKALNNSDCYIIPMMQRMENGLKKEIPKIIHYCWFGEKDMPDFLKECMESWAILCPDYEIRRWDESNYDVSKYLYTRQAAEMQRFGFVTDVARLEILYQYGGVYLDTDVKLLKSLDGLLYNKGFVGVEQWGNINSGGGIGAVPQHPMIKEMLDYRVQFPFVMEDGSLNTETNGLYETVPFIRHGMRIDNTLQIVNDMTVYPSSVFHPYDYMSCEEKIERDTISVHFFYGGWMDSNDKGSREKTQSKYREILGQIKKE